MPTDAAAPGAVSTTGSFGAANGGSNHRVVINADDFGLHPAVNRGICRAHQEGVVTSTSLMACGSAFQDAVERLRACPNLDVGIHLTLVEERPVSSAGEVSSLVGPDGRMLASHRHFARRWLSGRIRARDVRQELCSQVQRVLRSGIRPTHLDAHQHVHCLPGIWPMVVALAEEHRIPFVRLPRFESLRAAARGWMDSVLRSSVNLLAGMHARRWPATVHCADHVKGAELSGRMTGDALLRLLGGVRTGLTEILVHPGEDDPDLHRRYGHWYWFDWRAELEAVTDERVQACCRQGTVQLTRFSAAAAARQP